MNPEIQRLIEGNKRFRTKYFAKQDSLFYELQTGQKPKVMIIACSDSRVDPSVIFHCQPGELFVVRNVANLIPPYEETNTFLSTYAALDFATRILGVEHIILFGHMNCGGIESLVHTMDTKQSDSSDSYIDRWMQLAAPAYKKMIAEHGSLSLADQISLCEQYVLINSLENLLSIPWIKKRVAAQTLTLHAWYFDLTNGTICTYDQEQKNWGCVE